VPCSLKRFAISSSLTTEDFAGIVIWHFSAKDAWTTTSSATLDRACLRTLILAQPLMTSDGATHRETYRELIEEIFLYFLMLLFRFYYVCTRTHTHERRKCPCGRVFDFNRQCCVYPDEMSTPLDLCYYDSNNLRRPIPCGAFESSLLPHNEHKTAFGSYCCRWHRSWSREMSTAHRR
jgi:hypothetical protein